MAAICGIVAVVLSAEGRAPQTTVQLECRHKDRGPTSGARPNFQGADSWLWCFDSLKFFRSASQITIVGVAISCL